MIDKLKIFRAENFLSLYSDDLKLKKELKNTAKPDNNQNTNGIFLIEYYSSLVFPICI